MTNRDEQVAAHWAGDDIAARLLTTLTAAGKDIDALTVDDLAPVDAFHIRGRAATKELATWTDVRPQHLVLDVGCGVGGTSRYLASTTGCRVVGVDLTEGYCRAAETLSARVGLADRTEFHQASALALPFADDHFEVVWTEHVQMNIADKAGFYREIGRVLKPGGQFAFHDVFAGEGGALRFPVPWASDESISHLIGIDELRSLLSDLGFATERWEERVDASIAYFRDVVERLRKKGPAPVGLHVHMDDAGTKLPNLLRNLEEDRVRVVQAVMRHDPNSATVA